MPRFSFRRKRRNRRYFRPGFHRTGGYYGRFNKRRAGYGTEKKFYDMSITDASLAAAGQFLLQSGTGPSASTATIVDIPQGTGEQQRIGRRCTITNISLRLNIVWLSQSSADLLTARVAHESMRFIIFQDRQCNGAAVVSTDILQSDLFIQYRNLSNIKRFKILYDKLWTFNTTAVAAGDGAAADSDLVHKEYIKKINIKCFIPIEFNSTLGAITEMRTNNIGMIAWTRFGVRLNVVDSRCRVRFIDK